MLGAISWHRWSRLYMRRACWVLGAISWHRYSGTATHEGDERASTTEKRAPTAAGKKKQAHTPRGQALIHLLYVV